MRTRSSRFVLILLVARVVAAPVALRSKRPSDVRDYALTLQVCDWPVGREYSLLEKLTGSEAEAESASTSLEDWSFTDLSCETDGSRPWALAGYARYARLAIACQRC